MKRNKLLKQRPHFGLSGARLYLMAFFLPVVLLLLTLLSTGLYPLAGNRTPLTVDLYHQYAPFMAEFRRKLLEGSSLFYTWNSGLGQDFYSLFAYYLASPFNLLLVLFPATALPEAVVTLMLLKIGTASVSFAYFLKSTFTQNGWGVWSALYPKKAVKRSDEASDYALLIFSCLYALSGYVQAYFWNLMWLDAIVALPLVLAGLYRLFRKGQVGLYILALFYAFWSNFYVGFFVGLFALLYALVIVFSQRWPKQARAEEASHGLEAESEQVLEGGYVPSHKSVNEPNLSQSLLRVFLATLSAAFLVAVLLVPTYLALKNSSAVGDRFPTSFEFKMPVFDFIQRHLPLVAPNVRSGFANVYVGLLPALLLPIYVLAKHLSRREKVAHLALLAFFFFSFSHNVLDFIWHGLHYPNQLNHRYAFLYIALLLLMGFRALPALAKITKRQLLALLIGALAYLVLAQKILDLEWLQEQTYLTMGAVLISVYFLDALAKAIRYREQEERGEELGSKPSFSFRFAAWSLSLFVILELFLQLLFAFNLVAGSEYFTDRPSFVQEMSESQQILAHVPIEGLWRTEFEEGKTSNPTALHGYRGLSQFSSTSPKSTATWMRKIGYQGNNINSYRYTGATKWMDALFSLRYLARKEETASARWKELAKEGQWTLYENDSALPFAFLVKQDALSYRQSESGSPYEEQNRLFSALTGRDEKLYDGAEVDLVESTGYQTRRKTDFVVELKEDGKEGKVQAIHEASRSEQLYLYLESDKDVELSWKIQKADGAPAPSSTVKGALEPALSSQEKTVYRVAQIEFPPLQKGDRLELHFRPKEETGLKFSLVRENSAILQESLQALATQSLQNLQVRSSSFSGDIEAKEDGLLFFSLPYDLSWEAKVDGRLVRLRPLNSSFLLLPLSQGQHHIDLRFVPRGFKVGLMLSALGALLALLLLVWTKLERKSVKRGRKKANFEENQRNSEKSLDNRTDELLN